MFSERLKKLREENNLTMDKLVELYNNKFSAKMNKSTLSRYENGLQEPIYTVVVNLANFFGVTVDYISGGDSATSKNIILTEKELSLVTAYREQPQMQEAVNKLLNIE